MIAVPVFNMKGDRVGETEIDPDVLGGKVRPALLKQAIVAFEDHQRQDSARTKRRSDVVGSTRKLFRQKGTGNARMGAVRTPIRRGGGRTFAKRIPGSRKSFPKKMRRLARDSAVLAKIESANVMIIDDLACAEPKTKPIVSMIKALGVSKGCLLAVDAFERNLYLSGRNIQNADIRVLDDLNAYEVLRRPKLLFTRTAFDRVKQGQFARAEDAQGS